MGKAVLILSVLAGIGFIAWKCCSSCHPRPPPQLELDEWWGPKDLKATQDTSIRPFKVSFSQAMVDDLKSRLSKRRKFTPPLEGVGFQYGFNSVHLEKVLDYWQNKYDFVKRQDYLNQYSQFKTNVQGLDIHFIRVKPDVSKDTKVLPLLLLHGWPGSVREFYDIIPLLTKKRDGHDFVFEVIAPSLPGFGFSQAAVRPGLGIAKMAVIMRNLMHRLGHKTFYVQGGDWGAAIASALSTIFPGDILGAHTNMALVETKCNLLKTILGDYFPSFVVDEKLVDRMYPLSEKISTLIEEFGYFHLQATKPDTVGVGLTDSPAGLAAYILEKFSFWTVNEYKQRPDGGLTEKYTLDQLLDNLMMYWSSSSITTSMRTYAEEMSRVNREMQLSQVQTSVPTWVLQAKYEIIYQPPCMLRAKYINLIDTTVLPDGGHFIALEQPATLADDIFKAVKAFIEWRKTNPEKKTEL